MLCDGGTTVTDSFSIANIWMKPIRTGPALFGCESAVALSRFVEAWTYSALHPGIIRMVAKDIHDILDDKDKAYFRASRETA